MPSRKAVNELLSTHKTKRSPSKKRSPIKVMTDLPTKQKSSRKKSTGKKTPKKVSPKKKPRPEVATEAPMEQTEQLPELSDTDISDMSETDEMSDSSGSELKTDQSTSQPEKSPFIVSDSDVSSFDGSEAEEEDKEVLGIKPFEALVLGIGEPDALSKDELLQFFSVVSKEEVDYNSKNEDDLRFMARQYLLTVTPDIITENAMKMSQSDSEIADRYFEVIRRKIEEYQAELQNAKGVVQTAIEKFDNMVNNSQLEATERETFQSCLTELQKFQKELEKNGFMASSPPPSPKKNTVLKIAGAVGVAGALALAGRIAWDAGLRDKIMGAALIEMKVGDGFSNMVWNRYATFFNNRQNIATGDPNSILTGLDLEVGDDIDITKIAPGTNARSFLRKIPDSISSVMNKVLDNIEARIPYFYPERVREIDIDYDNDWCKERLTALFTQIKSRFFQLLATYSIADLLALIRKKKGDKYIGQAALLIWFLEIPPNMAPLVEKFGKDLDGTNKDDLASKLAADCLDAVPKLLIINWLYNCPIFVADGTIESLHKSTIMFPEVESVWARKLLKILSEKMTDTTAPVAKAAAEQEAAEKATAEKAAAAVLSPPQAPP